MKNVELGVDLFKAQFLGCHPQPHHHIQDQQLPTMHHIAAVFLHMSCQHIQNTFVERPHMWSTAGTSSEQNSFSDLCMLGHIDTWCLQSCCLAGSPGDWLSWNDGQHGGSEKWDKSQGPCCLNEFVLLTVWRLRLIWWDGSFILLIYHKQLWHVNQLNSANLSDCVTDCNQFDQIDQLPFSWTNCTAIAIDWNRAVMISEGTHYQSSKVMYDTFAYMWKSMIQTTFLYL